MANNLDLSEVTLEQLADSTNDVNTVGAATGRDGPLKPLVVRVTDHDDDVTAEEDDATKMALFYSRAHGHPWEKGPALIKKIYTAKDLGTGASATATHDAGVIDSVTLVDGGSGYQNPVVTVEDPDGGASGAQVSATVADGVITALTIDNGGTGYTDPTIVITDTIEDITTDTTVVYPNFDYTTFE